MSKLALQLNDYRLTTANILYHMPDYPRLLQSYLWQELDLQPEYPILMKFLKFWEDNLDGRIHSVEVASIGVITPVRMRYAAAAFVLH